MTLPLHINRHQHTIKCVRSELIIHFKVVNTNKRLCELHYSFKATDKFFEAEKSLTKRHFLKKVYALLVSPPFEIEIISQFRFKTFLVLSQKKQLKIFLFQSIKSCLYYTQYVLQAGITSLVMNIE